MAAIDLGLYVVYGFLIDYLEFVKGESGAEMVEVEGVVYVGYSDLEIVCGVARLLELVPK